MPALQTVLGKLNQAFGTEEGLRRLVANKSLFAPDAELGSGLIIQKDAPLFKLYQKYLDNIPGSIAATLKSVMRYALDQNPPTHVTFAWAPSYDYEITVWEVPDNKKTRGGITVLIKSPYPQGKGK